MKFIFDCEDEILLPFTYDFSEDVEKFLKLTKVLDIRKTAMLQFRLKNKARKTSRICSAESARNIRRKQASFLQSCGCLRKEKKLRTLLPLSPRLSQTKMFLIFLPH